MLRPIGGVEPGSSRDLVPAWDAIAPTQTRPCSDYWLITQPDHAALAGAIAAALGPPMLPSLDFEVIQGIAVHDDGWAGFDASAQVANGRPLSFLQFSPSDFVRAWQGSIERAENVGPMAGFIVSRHFWRLAKVRAEGGVDGPEEHALVLDFLRCEQARQERLRSGRSTNECEFWTDVLQFCDVVSLYLCCGSREDVVFPRAFDGKSLKLRREATSDQAAVCRFDPSPFAQGGVDLAVAGRRFCSERQGQTATFPFLLW